MWATGLWASGLWADGLWAEGVGDAVPIFIGPSVGTIVTVVDVAMTSINFALRFTHATDTPTYGLTGSLPAGVSFAGSTLSGTPTETGTFSGLVVTATDDDLDTAVSDTFTLRVVAELSAGAAYQSLVMHDFSMRI